MRCAKCKAGRMLVPGLLPLTPHHLERYFVPRAFPRLLLGAVRTMGCCAKTEVPAGFWYLNRCIKRIQLFGFEWCVWGYKSKSSTRVRLFIS